MTGIDTNVLVRYLVQDDEAQAAAATALMEKASPQHRIYLSAVVMIETIWVLKSVYNVALLDIAAVVLKLIDSSKVKVQDAAVFQEVATAGFDASYMDKLIVAAAQHTGCTDFYTFDKKLAKQTPAILLK